MHLKQIDKKGSPDRFGYEWEQYNSIIHIHEEHFLTWTILIEKNEWKNKSFLDVGCGMGRNSFWPMTYGAEMGIGIDIDDRSLEQAKRNLSPYPKYSTEKISAFDIPYKNKFDISFSIGVIHHLDDPKQAIQKMYDAVKSNGKVLIWVYGIQNVGWMKFFDPIRKLIFSRLPIELVHKISLLPTSILYLLLKFGFGKLKYYDLLRKYPFKQLRSIVFDQMLPKIAHYYTREDVESLMKSAPFVKVEIKEVNDMSWCAVGTK